MRADSDEAIDVVIEIPTGSRNKYEYDHVQHVIRLDRRLFTATTYPADYGFVPETLAGDGDPLDALALVADPTFPGCVVRVRILGMFSMRDEKGVDAKLICVLEHDPQWDGAKDIGDVPEHLRNEIAHFFSIYKDLEPEKSTEVQGFADRGGRSGRAGVLPDRLPCGRDVREGGTTMPFPRQEVQDTVDRYHELRRRIDEGLEPEAFGVLADFYTEDAVYIDGAWGRIEGRDAIAHWLVDSMLGMDDWKFPVEFTAIEGDDVVVKWTQIMPRTRPDGTPYRQSGYSRLIYAGNGKFSYEEDTYNMAHVLEDIEASGWTPNGSMNVPPAHPDRNFDIPPGARAG